MRPGDDIEKHCWPWLNFASNQSSTILNSVLPIFQTIKGYRNSHRYRRGTALQSKDLLRDTTYAVHIHLTWKVVGAHCKEKDISGLEQVAFTTTYRSVVGYS